MGKKGNGIKKGGCGEKKEENRREGGKGSERQSIGGRRGRGKGKKGERMRGEEEEGGKLVVRSHRARSGSNTRYCILSKKLYNYPHRRTIKIYIHTYSTRPDLCPSNDEINYRVLQVLFFYLRKCLLQLITVWQKNDHCHKNVCR